MARDFEALLVKRTTDRTHDVALWTKSSSEAGLACLKAPLYTLDSLATQHGAHVDASEARTKEEDRGNWTATGASSLHEAGFAVVCFLR